MFEKIAIIGLGVIGGSLAKAFKQKQMCKTIVGVDSSQGTIDQALIEGAIDDGALTFNHDADLIVIAVPISLAVNTLQEVYRNAKKGAWVLDVGSVKSNICDEAEKLLRDDITFIGGHPMAGSEKSGYENSRADLFTQAAFVLTPITSVEPEFYSWLEQLDVRIYIIDKEQHDLYVGYVSHLPHLIASTLVNTNPQAALDLASGGFKDTTRIAQSNPHHWVNICLYNKKMVDVLDDFIKEITNVKAMLVNENRDDLYQYLLKAKNTREQIKK